jgi:hypothetical protein
VERNGNDVVRLVPPAEPRRRGWRLNSREEIDEWLAERRSTLSALTAQDSPQLALEELAA